MPTKRRSVKQREVPVLPIVLVAAVLAIAAAVTFAVTRQPESPAPAPEPAQPSLPHVSFVAVGDNLPDDNIGTAAARAGGTYDYTPIFAPLADRIRQADLAYIDQETHIGGAEIGPLGYPSFNTTDEMADAVVDAGFDFVASATNHSYDWGPYGAIEHSRAVWNAKPVAFTGTATDYAEAAQIATLERGGLTFALLDYTYGVNAYDRSELPEYAVNFIDEARISTDVAAARQVADVVIVAMHWGTELQMSADAEQIRLAQFLADLDVDLVLGSHPHVIGPMAWVENSTGNGHRTLVAYSLGNFLADHENPSPETALEGMLTCDFVCTENGSYDRIDNVHWVPLVCHANADRTEFAVYAVDDYPDDLARTNRSLTRESDPKAWLRDTTARIVGPQWL